MPIVPNIQIIDPEMGIGTDIAGNPITGGIRPRPTLVGSPSFETGETNPTPLLITPVIEVPYRPLGSGASIIAEPDLGRPINSISQPTNEPILAETPNKNPLKNLIINPPPFMGGGGGGGGADAGKQEETNAPKKTNYVLYGGILLAVIVAYKLLFSKNEN